MEHQQKCTYPMHRMFFRMRLAIVLNANWVMVKCMN